MDDLLLGPVRPQHARPAQDLTRLLLFALVGAVLAALPGCGDDELGPEGVGVLAQQGAGGAIAWGLGERPAHLDPLFTRTPAEQLVSRQIYEPLISELTGPFDDVRQVPGLALSAAPSSDATVWRLRLRPGVSFSDGAPFNAAAVLANVERWREHPAGQALIGEVLVDAPRPELVRFILPAADRNFDRTLASPQLGVVSPRALADVSGGELDADAAGDSGTGAFELRERSPDRLLLARSTEWWGADRALGPGVDQLEFLVIPARDERFAELQEGAIHVASDLGTAVARARSDPLLTVVDGSGPGGLAIERSVRGIPPGDPAPPLNGVWRTGIAVD